MSFDEVLSRRFGPGFPRPCADPNMIECALWECQERNRCKKSFVTDNPAPDASQPSVPNGNSQTLKITR